MFEGTSVCVSYLSVSKDKNVKTNKLAKGAEGSGGTWDTNT